MDELWLLIQGILGFGLNVISFFFKLIMAFIASGIAISKKRNGLFWGILTFIVPLVFFVTLLMPKRYPKFSSYLNEKEEFKGKNPVVASIMALGAIVAKSDGTITEGEILTLKRFLTSNFGVSKEELNNYAGAFNYGKNNPEAYKEFARVIKGFYRRRDIILAIAYLFVAIAMEDGQISEAEDRSIRNILFELGVSEYEYDSIKNSFAYKNYNQYRGQRGNSGQSGYNFGETEESLIKKYTEILEVDEDADLNEIKKAYRKGVKEYHPDKIASKGMPEDYVAYANKKIVEINEAYEYLKKVKAA